MKISLRLSMVVLPVLALGAAAVPQAWADTVVADNQIVQGSQCIGPTCANGENMTGAPLLFIKAPDTPGLRLLQAGGSFGSQVWDVEGNEGNFFVKDSTDGGTLPFRIRPGAPTSSIDIGANGNILDVGVVQQDAGGMGSRNPVDGDDLLTKLASVPVDDYTYAGATHIAPDPASFFSTFGIGSAGNVLAPQDVAGVALASVKALDAQVADIQLTPGPQGASGTHGPKGDTGATGPRGPAGPAANTAALKTQIRNLQVQNTRLARSVSKLQKQMKAVDKILASH